MKPIASLFAVWMLSIGTTEAHTLVPVWPSLSEGVLHPLLGLDHCLALMGLGLWSQQSHLRFPAQTFIPMMLMAMSVGGVLGHLAPQWPSVDHMISASVFVIGALLTGLLSSHRLLLFFLACGFLLLHGYAHGMELPMSSDGLSYGAGFVLTSAVLIGIGRGLGHLTQRKRGIQALIGIGLMGAGSFWLITLR